MELTKEEIKEKINGMLVDKLDVEEKDLTDDALMESDLGADSLDVMELVMEMEKTFQIHIPDDDLDGMFNCPLKKIYELVEEKLKHFCL